MPKLNVVHLMRTYGASGGEQQLSQYFHFQNPTCINEAFVFVYRDNICSRLLSSRAPHLKKFVLFGIEIRSGHAWFEFFIIIPLLIYLQFKFFRFILNQHTDIVVAHGFQAALVSWPSTLLIRGCRWCYMHRVTKSINYSRHVFKWIYKPFDAIVGNSQAVTASLIEIAGSARAFTIENGLILENFDIQSKELREPIPWITGPILVSVGRLLPYKGHAVIINAFKLIVRHSPEASLWIVGDGSEMENLKLLAMSSNVSTRIHLLGRREDVPAVLAKGDIFVNASTREGMSNAVLEAMAASLPSVVVDAPGVSECHIQGQTGLIVENDADSIAEAVRSILENSDFSKKMGTSARKRVEEYYSMNKNCERFLSLFSRLTGRNLCAES